MGGGREAERECTMNPGVCMVESLEILLSKSTRTNSEMSLHDGGRMHYSPPRVMLGGG